MEARTRGEGCVELGLAYEMDLFANGGKHLSAFSLGKVLTQIKQTEKYSWFSEVSRHTLANVLIDLGEAYNRFFAIKPARFTKTKLAKAQRIGKKLTTYDLEGHPKFKKLKDKDFRFPVRTDHFYLSDGYAIIEKIGKIRYQTDKEIHGKFHNPRIKYINNMWLLTFATECENQARTLTDTKMGIDLGIEKLATVRFGTRK